MRTISLLFALMITGTLSTQAQRNLTVQCEVLSPVYNQNITSGSSVDFEYKITNSSDNAADSLQTGDTIRLVQPLSRFDGISFKPFIMEMVLVSAIPAGGSIVVSSGTPIPFSNIETLADPSDGNKFKSKAFMANKQYSWFCSVYEVSAPTSNIPIVSISTYSDTGLVWINRSTGTKDVSVAEGILKMYPNPAVNQLSFDYFFNGKEVTIAILDGSGRIAMTKEFRNLYGAHKIDLDIAAIPAGTYFLRLNESDESAIARFSVQR